jgi:hypothetical protein
MTVVTKGTVSGKATLVSRRRHMSWYDVDIFEKLADGTCIWRTCASGELDAQQKLQNLADCSENEFFLIDIETGGILRFELGHSNSRKQIKRAANG